MVSFLCLLLAGSVLRYQRPADECAVVICRDYTFCLFLIILFSVLYLS